MKRKALSATVLVFLVLALSQASRYSELFGELLRLMAVFFIPALFPVLFLTLLLSKSLDLERLSRKRPPVAKILIILLSLIAGTVGAVSLLKRVEFKRAAERGRALALLTGPSVGYLLALWSVLGGQRGLLLVLTALSLKALVAYCSLELGPIASTDSSQMVFDTFDECYRSFTTLLASMAIVTFVIPLFDAVGPDELRYALLGLLEFARPALYLSRLKTAGGFLLAAAVAEFNGLASLIQIKKSHPQMRLTNFVLDKVLLTGLTVGLTWLWI